MSTKPAAEIQLTIDGVPVSAPPGTTIFDAARLNGVTIPTLCHQQNENPVGVCRVCVVDVGQRVYAASCIRQVEPGMAVKTATDLVLAARRTLVELLMSDHPSPCARQQQSGDCELEQLASDAGIKEPRFPRRTTPRGKDDSSAVIAVDHEACILCDRCVRGCDDIRHNWVLARRGKGYQAGIAFDNNLPMSESSCVSCGECMVSCPTGALTNKRVVGTQLGQGDVLNPAELLQLPIFETVLRGIKIVGSLVGTRVDLKETFELHADGRTEIVREMRSLDQINESIAQVLHREIEGRLVFDLRS